MTKQRQNGLKDVIVRFLDGDESRVVIETKNFENSLFSSQYANALRVWKNICNAQKDLIGDPQNNEDGLNRKDDVNNIIAFCGDRGEGKTSCLMSFANLLRNAKQENEFVKDILGNNDISELVSNVMIIPLIDPMYFDEKHHLLDYIMGQMFSRIEDRPENKTLLDSCVERKSMRSDVLKQFQKVRLCIKQTNANAEEMYDELEELTNCAAGVRLKKEITELFRLYVAYIGKEKLVLQIDDIDLNIRYGYEMAEDIRKYLCNEYCILLMAVKVEQLTEVIQIHMSNDMKDIEKRQDAALAMAHKYVTKLLPYANRINMPHVDDLAERRIENEKLPFIKGSLQPQIKDYLVRLIYDRTRYLFYNGKGTISPIMPTSLRALRHLLKILEDMETYKTDEGPEENKTRFKDYFYHVWTARLSNEDQIFVQRLIASSDLSSTNKFVTDYLDDKKITAKEGLLQKILDKGNCAHNISVGDVFYVLNTLSHSASDDNTKLLVFFLYSYYSIRLYDLYDEITQSAEDLYPEEKVDEANIYRVDAWYKNTNKLQRFVNGSFFTYELGELLPKEGNEVARDRRVLKTEKILADFKYVKDHNPLYLTAMSKTDEELTKEEKDIVNAYPVAFRRCEFYAMFTIGAVRKDDKFSASFDRKELEPYYLRSYNRFTNYMVFDILAPFVNSINIQYCYNRFEELLPDFYNRAYQYEWSILRGNMGNANAEKIKGGCEDAIVNEYSTEEEKCAEQKSKEKEMLQHYLASSSIIRVSDVQVSLLEQLAVKRSANNEGTLPTIMSNVYSNISKSGIKLYDSIGNRSPYEIGFTFLKPFYDMFEDTAIQQTFNSILEDWKTEQKNKKTPKRKPSKELTSTQIINLIKKQFGITGKSDRILTEETFKELLLLNTTDQRWIDIINRVYSETREFSTYNKAIKPMIEDKDNLSSIKMMLNII